MSFTIITANVNSGGPHRLDSRAPLETPNGDHMQASLEVRVNYGLADPWTCQPVVWVLGDRLELISLSVLQERRAAAIENGGVYAQVGKTVWVREWSSAARAAGAECDEMERAFRAMIALDLFRLPVTH